ELGLPFEEAMERQRTGLQQGGVEAAEAFDDPRFADLVHAFDASLRGLPAAIRRYRRLMAGWDAFLGAFYPEHDRRWSPGLPLKAPLSSPSDEWVGVLGADGERVASSTTVV
ncbi:MAG: hypothetical protein WBR18_11905, partial [Anaerolineales bacterium]